ncbi:MAG: sulfotransferase family 2 domain-containing protein [Candidatus Paceibacteria bacterium]
MKPKKPIYIFLHLPKNGGTSFTANLEKKLGHEKIAVSKNIRKLSEIQKRNVFVVSGHENYYGVHEEFPGREPGYIVFIRDPAERRVSQYNHDIARMNSNKKPSFKKWYKLQIKDEQTFLLNKKFKGIPGRKAPKFTNNFISKFKVGNSKTLKLLGYKVLKIYDFFRKGKRNKESEFENAKRLLENCWTVSTTDNLDKNIPKIFRAMGLDTKWEKYRTAKSQGEKTSKEKKEVKKSFELDEETRNKIYKDNPYDVRIYEFAKELETVSE